MIPEMPEPLTACGSSCVSKKVAQHYGFGLQNPDSIPGLVLQSVTRAP